MAEDDIYGSKRKYERFKDEIDTLTSPPTPARGTKAKYRCINPANIEHFKTLFRHFDARDLSFIRRHRLLQSMRLICYLTSKNLAECSRDDINEIVAGMHAVYQSPKSKQTFISDLRYFWKIIFPEKDSQGRPDETVVPYAVRHLSTKIDRSRQKLRQDKLAWGEFERIISYFGADPRMQCYLTLALESLARPQELLYRTVGNVELHDCYAKVFLTEHGKEGPGLLQCIDSYPYLVKWLEVHPLKKDKDAFLFVNVGDTNWCRQLKPTNINKMLRTACRALGINKPVTCYSLKRNGVTIRRLRGESDMEIQHAARWTSTKQLKTYDMSNQEEAFRRELEKRGIIPTSTGQSLKAKRCEFCNLDAGFGQLFCPQCKRPLDRTVLKEEAQRKEQEIDELRRSIAQIAEQMVVFKEQVLRDLANEILAVQSSTQVPSDRFRRAASSNGARHVLSLASSRH